MKKKIIFAVIILAIYIGTLLSIRVAGLIQDKIFFAALLGILLNIINFSVAIFLFMNSMGKNNETFLIYNFGGLGVRILILLAVIFYCLKFLNIETYAFIFHFLIFYFLLQIMEIKIFAENKQR